MAPEGKKSVSKKEKNWISGLRTIKNISRGWNRSIIKQEFQRELCVVIDPLRKEI